MEGGVLDDGTCQWGRPALMPENVEALSLWSDVNLLGWDAAIALRQIAVTEYEMSDLLVKLRTIASEMIENKRKAKPQDGAGN